MVNRCVIEAHGVSAWQKKIAPTRVFMRLLLKRRMPQSSYAKIILHEIPFGVVTNAFSRFVGQPFSTVLTKLITCSFVIIVNLPLADIPLLAACRMIVA